MANSLPGAETEVDGNKSTTKVKQDYTIGDVIELRFTGTDCADIEVESESSHAKTGKEKVKVEILDSSLEGSEVQVKATASVDVGGTKISHEVTWVLQVKKAEVKVEDPAGAAKNDTLADDTAANSTATDDNSSSSSSGSGSLVSGSGTVQLKDGESVLEDVEAR